MIFLAVTIQEEKTLPLGKSPKLSSGNIRSIYVMSHMSFVAVYIYILPILVAFKLHVKKFNHSQASSSI